jgi:hypothetical protein
LKNDVNAASKSNKQKKIFYAVLKVTDKLQDPEPDPDLNLYPNPDPLVEGTDKRIRSGI